MQRMREEVVNLIPFWWLDIRAVARGRGESMNLSEYNSRKKADWHCEEGPDAQER